MALAACQEMGFQKTKNHMLHCLGHMALPALKGLEISNNECMYGTCGAQYLQGLEPFFYPL